MLKILFFLPSLALGGAERQAILLAEHLRGAGHQVVIVGFGQDGVARQLCKNKDIACKALRFPLAPRTLLGKFFSVAELWHILSMEKADVILGYCMTPNVFAAHLWQLVGAQAFFWGQRDEGLTREYLDLFPAALEFCSGFVSNSLSGIHFLNTAGILDSKIHYIPNGVQLFPPQKSAECWRNAFNISDATLLVTMVANLSQFKEHDLLLYAWAIVKSRLDTNTTLVLAGRGDDRASYLYSLAHRLGIEDSIVFAGAIDDIGGLLSASDCAVFASLHEGLPNSVLEAMSAGLPVVALDILGTREALGENSNNCLVTEKTPLALADAICDMLTDPFRRDDAGAANHVRATTIYSPSAMYSSYERLLEELPQASPHRLLAFKSLILSLLRTTPGKIKALLRWTMAPVNYVKQCMERLYALRLSCRLKSKKQIPILKNLKIGLVVLIHNRPQYLEMCLESLFQSNYRGLNITFLLHDDGSDDKKVHNIINKNYNVDFCIHRFRINKGGNSWGAAYNSAMRELTKIDEFDVLISCDSDALFHPQWLQQTLPIFLWAKQHHGRHLLGPFSPFNSSDKDFHKVLGQFDSPHGQYWVKEQMGALVYCWLREDFERWGRFEECKDDETLKTTEFRQSYIRNFCSATSYVEHMGQDSVLNQWRPTPVRRAVFGLRLAKEPRWPEALEQVGTLGFYRDVRSLPPSEHRSELLLDIVIPAAPKDLKVLPLAILGMRRNLQHPIGDVIVAVPRESVSRMRHGVEGLDVQVVDEQDILPCSREDIVYTPFGKDRSGWLAQQILKFNAVLMSNHGNCLVVDSDTVLLRKMTFERGGKALLQVADEYHEPYYNTFFRLFGYNTTNLISNVTHMMCFNKQFLSEMMEELVQRWGVAWYDAIQLAADKFSLSGFSEYETYGHWLQCNKPNYIFREYFFNKAMPRSALGKNHILEEQFAEKYVSVSFQSYLQN